MSSIIEVSQLVKTFDDFKALNNISLNIEEAEIFALLGPNGAGKTTLISIICGLVNPSEGTVRVAGFDIIKQYRQTRELIGLVPQELTTDAFSIEEVSDLVRRPGGSKQDFDTVCDR